MAEEHLSTIRQEKVPGEKTVFEVQEKLRTIIAFSYLGKRATMSNSPSPEDWGRYFIEIGCPDGQDTLMELAFDALFRMASEAWQMLSDPEDEVEGHALTKPRPQAPAQGGAA